MGLEFSDGILTVSLQLTRKTGVCPVCGKRCRYVEEFYSRCVRDWDICGGKCFIQFPERKIRCSCGFRGFEKLEFIDSYSRCTLRFEEYIFRLCELMTIQDVSKLLGLHWTTVKHIDKKYLGRLVKGLEDIHPTRIGVDEITYQKGHKYLTVVRDIDLKKVIWIGFKRKKETLDQFFTELGETKSKKIKVAVVDMWDPYISSIQEFTNSEIVFDRFHFSKIINEVVDEVRKIEFKKADPVERKQMKNKRFLILSRNKNLNEEKRLELNQLMSQNEKLYKTYLLKEQILDIFDEISLDEAVYKLVLWHMNVIESGIQEFEGVLKTISKYLYGILNYFKHRLTNAASEAFNNKINVIKRRAYGFHDIDYLKLKIIQNCGVTKS